MQLRFALQCSSFAVCDDTAEGCCISVCSEEPDIICLSNRKRHGKEGGGVEPAESRYAARLTAGCITFHTGGAGDGLTPAGERQSWIN